MSLCVHVTSPDAGPTGLLVLGCLLLCGWSEYRPPWGQGADPCQAATSGCGTGSPGSPSGSVIDVTSSPRARSRRRGPSSRGLGLRKHRRRERPAHRGAQRSGTCAPMDHRQPRGSSGPQASPPCPCASLLSHLPPLTEESPRKLCRSFDFWSSRGGTVGTNPTIIHEDTSLIPALAQGSRIQHCPERWCRSQTRLGSGIPMAVASDYCSNSTPSLGTSICCGCSPKKTKERKKKRKKLRGKSLDFGVFCTGSPGPESPGRGLAHAPCSPSSRCPKTRASWPAPWRTQLPLRSVPSQGFPGLFVESQPSSLFLALFLCISPFHPTYFVRHLLLSALSHEKLGLLRVRTFAFPRPPGTQWHSTVCK